MPDSETALAPATPKPVILGTFAALQSGLKTDALAMKVKMYYLGLLVSELSDHFRAEHGETRGRPEKNDTVSVISGPSLESYLEEHFDVSYRTCIRHRHFWEACTQSDKHAKAVKALNGVWVKHVEALQLEAPKKSKAPAAALALQERCTELAEAVEGLLDEADSLELHTLFEKPTPAGPVIDAETGDADDSADRKSKAIEVIDQLCRKLGGMKKTYLYAPKPHRERLQTELEEALAEVKKTLTPKGGKK
jgi:hypothetical protein